MPRLALFAIPLTLALHASAAWAHAALTGSSPAEGSVVATAGFPLELRFNGHMDPTRSRLTLTTADGKSRKLDSRAGSAPATIAADVAAVPPGPCILRYDVLSHDGHLVTGIVRFTAAER